MSGPSPLYARQSAAVRQIQQAEKQQDHPLCDGSKSLDDDLAQETQDFMSDQGKARLVIIGRNGTGKSTMINHVLLLSQAEGAPVDKSAVARSLETASPAILDALKGRTVAQAEAEGIQVVLNPHPAAYTDGITQQCRNELAEYIISGPRPVGAPKSFLLAAGNSAGSTTGTNTEVRYAEVPGAIQHFRSRQELQTIAYDCVVRMQDLQDLHGSDFLEQTKLQSVFCAITGQQQVPTSIASTQEINLQPDFEAVAGKTLVYSGHDSSLESFASFLRERLVVSQIKSTLHAALEHTVIYWPSKGVEVPFLDTPGTSDTNPLNANMTQQALDDAIARSSQLLLCGQKTFATEADLQPYAVLYFKHAITAKQGWFAIQGVLMASGYYTAESLYDPAIQPADRERVTSSEKQLQLWLQMANAELPTSQQASPARLEVLLKRCGVKVIYMQLYASMCLQPQERLQEIALTVGAPLEELLQRTNGPWLLGLPRQLQAEAAEPYMQRLSDVYLEEMVRKLHAQLKANRETTLTVEDNDKLAHQSRTIRRTVLKLQYGIMGSNIKSGLKVLKGEVQELFVALATSCNQVYADKTADIQAAWRMLWADWQKNPTRRGQAGRVKMAFVERAKARTFCTTTYKNTFPFTPAHMATFWDTASLKTELTKVINHFTEEVLLETVKAKTVDCLCNSVPVAALKPLVEQAAWACLRPSLSNLTDKLVNRLLKPAALRALQREAQVNSIRNHLMVGSLDGPLGTQQSTLRTRLKATFTAVQDVIDVSLQRHVNTEVVLFERLLLVNEKNKRAQMEICLEKLLKHMASVAIAATQPEEDEKCRQAYTRALALQADIRQQTKDLLQQEDVSKDMQGLAYCVSRFALLHRQLENNLDLQLLLDEPTQIPEAELHSCCHSRVNVTTDLEGVGRLPTLEPTMDLTSLKHWSGLRLPSMSEQEWDAFSNNSLAASLQFLIWPQPELSSILEEGGSKHAKLWMGIKAAIAMQLSADWGMIQKEPDLKQRLMVLTSKAGMGVEAYVRHVMEPDTQMGLVELAAFVRACCGSVFLALNIQIWQPNYCNNFVLSGVADLSEDVKPDMAAYHLMLVMLPKSCKLVWLPLLPHAHATPEFMLAQWQTRLDKLDAKMLQLIIPEEIPPNALPQGPPAKPARVSAISGRLQRTTRSASKAEKEPGCPDSKRKTKQDVPCPKQKLRRR